MDEIQRARGADVEMSVANGEDLGNVVLHAVGVSVRLIETRRVLLNCEF